MSKPHHLSTVVPHESVPGPLLFSIDTHPSGEIIAMGFSIIDMGLILNCTCPSSWMTAKSAQISACLSNISVWMRDCHLQLNHSKTELLVFPANLAIQYNFYIELQRQSKHILRIIICASNQITSWQHLKMGIMAGWLVGFHHDK